MRRVPLLLLGAGILIGGILWTLGWSPLFAVRTIDVQGATTISDGAVRDALASSRTLPRIDRALMAQQLTALFPVIASVSVERVWPHGLSVALTERHPEGVWCKGDTCQLFDRTRTFWGTALPSRGTLLISVRDERANSDVPDKLFAGLLSIVDQLNGYDIHAMQLILPDQAPGDVLVQTNKGYELILDALGDIEDQLDTLAILLAQHAGGDTFAPTHIDIRTPGRVFYR